MTNKREVSEADRARAFAEWFEKRGGWVSGEVYSIALDAAMVGFSPDRAHAIAVAYVYDSPIKSHNKAQT